MFLIAPSYPSPRFGSVADQLWEAETALRIKISPSPVHYIDAQAQKSWTTTHL
jgi:hypothetical protein